MQNLNDTIYDYKFYGSHGPRDHKQFIISDDEIEKRLISYEDFEKSIIKNIKDKKRTIYLRFCDGEYEYYERGGPFINFIRRFFERSKSFKERLGVLIRFVQKFVVKTKTCWGEKADKKLIQKHFEFFDKNRNIVFFFPHVSDYFSKMFKSSLLWDYLKKNNIQFGHFCYIYHFLNKLRQDKIDELNGIKIAYITSNNYTQNLDHYKIADSFEQGDAKRLFNIDFSTYDLILLGGGISSPLYASYIINCTCPIVDSGYLLSIRDSKSNNDRAFCSVLP